MDTFTHVFLVGIGATALTDLWSLVRRPLLGVARPDFGLVGRWLAHMPRGRFRHDAIAAAPRMAGERTIGWVAHYLIGVAFAALLPLVAGAAWLREPTLWPAMAVGICTVIAPFLLMQPGMGAGIAASRSPRPGAARWHSLVTHAVFGLGLYAAAVAIRSIGSS